MVSELEKGRNDLERKVTDLFMDNCSLVKKLKASHAVEMEQIKGINSLENQLAQALEAQVNVHIYMHSHQHSALMLCFLPFVSAHRKLMLKSCLV